MSNNERSEPSRDLDPADAVQDLKTNPDSAPKEIGGPKGPEPTRYGDWEKAGRCIDF